LLLILSDVEGLYAQFPSREVPDPAPIREVSKIDASIEALAADAVAGVGTGGMRTKIEAARIATAFGIRTVIAHGRREKVVEEVVSGRPVGTTFLPRPGRQRGRKRWIAAGSRPRGCVRINERAAQKLLSEGVSLLAVGVVGVEGEFDNGDLIEVCSESGTCLARGLTNYSAAELRRIQGLRSDQFEAVLGCRSYEEVIHRDNLALIE
jgi:glutamate 5-kinase